MCLIAFSWDQHPKYKLILAANRDEFYDRPTAPATFWQDHPTWLAGRDLKALGTWMGITKNGKFAALTNYRDPQNIREDVRTRGDIITQFFESEANAATFVQSLHEISTEYNGFNFLGGSLKELVHYSNEERKLNVVSPGIYGLSNALLDTPWPKVEQLKKDFEEVISRPFAHEDLFEILQNQAIFEEEILPDTGVSKEWEKVLSAICIRSENYGTCSSTVLTIDRFGEVNFTERTFGVGNKKEETNNYQFTIDGEV